MCWYRKEKDAKYTHVQFSENKCIYWFRLLIFNCHCAQSTHTHTQAHTHFAQIYCMSRVDPHLPSSQQQQRCTRSENWNICVSWPFSRNTELRRSNDDKITFISFIIIECVCVLNDARTLNTKNRVEKFKNKLITTKRLPSLILFRWKIDSLSCLSSSLSSFLYFSMLFESFNCIHWSFVCRGCLVFVFVTENKKTMNINSRSSQRRRDLTTINEKNKKKNNQVKATVNYKDGTDSDKSNRRQMGWAGNIKNTAYYIIIASLCMEQICSIWNSVFNESTALQLSSHLPSDDSTSFISLIKCIRIRVCMRMLNVNIKWTAPGETDTDHFRTLNHSIINFIAHFE